MQMQKIYLTILSLIVIFTNTFSQWFFQHHPPATPVQDIFFTLDSTGYMITRDAVLKKYSFNAEN
jgi:hypothetical protein